MKCLALKTSNIKICLFFKISQNVYGNILINDRVNLFSPYFTEFLHAVVVSYVKYPCYWERLNWYMQLCVRIFLPPDLSSSYFNSSIPAIRSLYNHKRKKKKHNLNLLVHSKWLINSNKIPENIIKKIHTNIWRIHSVIHKW